MTTRSLHVGAVKQDVVTAVNEALNGNLNNVATISLTVNVASTTVADRLVSTASHISFTPKTANAAAEFGNGTMYVVCADGSFVITHANNAQADRTFTYARFGG